MARKRTLNYRDFRTDFAEGEEPKREDVEEEDEDEDEDEEEDEEAPDEEKEGGEEDEEAADEDEDEEGPPKKKKKAVKKKEPKPKAVRAKKSRAGKIVRMRVVWGVFDNSNKRIEIYDYNKKHDAEEHATRLQTDKKQTFFVQPVKIPFVEEEK